MGRHRGRPPTVSNMPISLRQFLFLIATDQRQGFLANILKAFLWLLSWAYYLGLSCILLGYRAGLFRKHKLPRPVISVGNITWGGVGKTPFVIWLVEKLKAQNLKPVILTRGYRAQNSHGEKISDEAKMLEDVLKDVPVLVGKNRAASARQFLKTQRADVFILDDGFQHWRLYRDMDIVLIDTTNPWGNQQLLPRGILREPLSSLRRAQAVILTKTDLGQENIAPIKNCLIELCTTNSYHSAIGKEKVNNKISSNLLVAETVHKAVSLEDIRNASTLELSSLKNKRIASLCSIGNPKSFEATLKNLGAQVIKSFVFMDHHTYTNDEIEEIVQECLKENISTIVTTQKDAVKLACLADIFNERINIFCLHIDISFVQREDEFLERIQHIIRP